MTVASGKPGLSLAIEKPMMDRDGKPLPEDDSTAQFQSHLCEALDADLQKLQAQVTDLMLCHPSDTVTT